VLSIALDATYSVGPDPSGVAVYSSEMLSGIAHASPHERFLFCFRPHRYLRSYLSAVPANASRFLLHDRWRVPSRADLFHGLNQRMPEPRFRRAVCTFHDLFVMTGAFSTVEFRDRFTRLARHAAQMSDLIITVSAFTASQVESLLGVEPARIRVIHHGVRAPRPASVARESVILHVGAVQHRKNIARLVEAFERVPPEWRLVIAGSAGFGAPEILARIAVSPARARISVTGFISEERKQKLYARASIFAFPSLAEGFGIPVLEAMAAGVPVLCSSSSALPEVAGDCAVFVEPERVESIGEGLERLIGDERLRSDLAGRGRIRAGRFTWDAAVEKVWRVYRELLPGRLQ
jgi:glycosyltransferase involved in cell wall biosynthesis